MLHNKIFNLVCMLLSILIVFLHAWRVSAHSVTDGMAAAVWALNAGLFGMSLGIALARRRE